MKKTIAIRYTPGYDGAKPVRRKHNFDSDQEAAKFLTRMKKMYPNTTEL